MQDWFSIDEVTFLLQTSAKTIRRLLESKELKGVKRVHSWSISKASLRKWVLSRARKACAPRDYKNENQYGIKPEQSSGQTFDLNWYIYARKPSLRGKLRKPRRAVLKLQGAFRRFARRWAEGDWATQDDLVQEMSLAVLQCREVANMSFFVQRAKSRALNYLDRERRRRTVPLEEKHLAREQQVISTPEILRLLLDVGIPREQLRELLGLEFDPDFEVIPIGQKDAAGKTLMESTPGICQLGHQEEQGCQQNEDIESSAGNGADVARGRDPEGGDPREDGRDMDRTESKSNLRVWNNLSA